MIDLTINKTGLEHNIQKAKENHIIIPTIAQMQNPDLIPEKIKAKLSHTGLWDVDPVNLFRISWHNEAKEQGGLFQAVPNYVEIPSKLSGVPCRIIAMSGIGDITIGDTICAPECVEPLPFVKISAPTMEMTFSVNDSPYAGREGKFVTSRQLRDRLFRETLKDVSLRVTEIDGATDAFNVAGRGEMSLSILIETMRREGYEFQVSPPRVLYRTIDGKKCEPIERLVADVPSESVGAVIEKLGSRKGDLIEMTPVGSRMKLEFLIPARGLFGYRNEFLTDTRGEGIMASVFDSYAPYKGDLSRRNTGSLVSFETGESVSYGLFNAQERGALFIGPGVKVYEGMIVGVSPKQEDITVNVCKKKQMTNMRAAGSDEALRLVPPRKLSLEQCLEFLADDELLEVTPESLRMRKTILNHEKRMKATHGGKKK